MLVQWQGSRLVRRVVGDRVWGPENDWACPVADLDEVARILAVSDAFEVADAEGELGEAEGVEEEENQ